MLLDAVRHLERQRLEMLPFVRLCQKKELNGKCPLTLLNPINNIGRYNNSYYMLFFFSLLT